MGKQKILIFSDCYIYGGSEKLMAFLLKNQTLNENFAFLYYYRKHRGYEEGLKNEGLLGKEGILPLHLLSNETLFYKINCLKISRFLKLTIKMPFFLIEKVKVYFIWNLLNFILLLIKTKPTIIHVNNGGYPGAKSCNTLVVANYLTIRSKIVYQVNNQAQERKNYFEKTYDRFINKRVDCFINASSRAKQQLVEKRLFDTNKIHLVENCAPLKKIEKSREEIFKELNIKSDCFLITEVAFLTERKGQRYLIDALAYLYNNEMLRKEKVYCAFIGNGEDEEVLKDRINKLDLKSNIFLLGYKKNSEDYIAACDLFVLPSIRDEDMPLVLISALGYAKPIVATDFAGISQVIESETNGILIKNDLTTFKDNLADQIYRLYCSDALRKKIGMKAEMTYSNYSPENYGTKLKLIYDNLYAG